MEDGKNASNIKKEENDNTNKNLENIIVQKELKNIENNSKKNDNIINFY